MDAFWITVTVLAIMFIIVVSGCIFSPLDPDEDDEPDLGWRE